MGSAGPDESSQKAVEPDLIDVGKRLFRRPWSTEELLNLLEKVESLLAKVWQQPPMSTRRAMVPVMKALVVKELLYHEDVNVQVALASCFNELTRITAPDFTYEDDTMRVVFQLFMVAFKQLSCESGCNCYRAQHIVKTMAKVRSSMMLLDVDNDGLVVKMFRLFLKNIRSDHPSELFEYMERIMTLVIEESDEISFELLRPLLASVKMRNKDTSLISWELGKKVFENCATKIQCYLREALKAKNLKLDDYAEIVASICHDTSNEKNMVLKEVASTAGDRSSKAVLESRALPSNTKDGGVTNLDDEISIRPSKGCHRIMHPGTDGAAPRIRRGRKPNTVMRPEEGYDHTWKRGDRYPNEEKEDMALPSDLANSNIITDSSQKKVDSSNEESLNKKGQPNKKESMINQHNNLETSKKKILKPKEKIGKRATAGSGNISMEKKEGILGEERADGADKVGTPVSIPAKAKSLRKEKEKKKKSKRPLVDGALLVNLRIQVWWPIDQVFYAGTITAFDPETKKHKIIYDDDETEILDLKEEIWELLVDEWFPEKQEVDVTDHSSPPREPMKSKEKSAKRKAATFKKQHAASSSKRLKDESISKTGENPSPGSTHHVGVSGGTKSVQIPEDATTV